MTMSNFFYDNSNYFYRAPWQWATTFTVLRFMTMSGTTFTVLRFMTMSNYFYRAPFYDNE